jgi:hypothetical protein
MNRFIGLIVLCAVAISSLISNAQVSRFFLEAQQRKVDVVMVGDSNQLYQGHGWDHGFSNILSQRYGLYATGIHWLGENFGLGNGVGYMWNTQANASAGLFSYTETFQNDWLNPYYHGDMRPCHVIYLPTGLSLNSIGIGLNSNNVLYNLGDRIKFKFAYRIPVPGGSFRPIIRQGTGPYTIYHQSPITYNYTNGNVSFAEVSGNVPNNGPLEARTSIFNAAPVEFYYGYVQNMKRQTGFSVNTLYGYGGQSSRDMAEAIGRWPLELWAAYFNSIAERQDGNPMVLVRLFAGLNDRVETEPSVRYEYPPTSPQAYADNITFILDTLQSTWELLGYNPDNLHIVITLPQPVSNPQNAQIVGYENIARTFYTTHKRITVIQTSSLVTYQEMIANSWFINPGDANHLSLNGFNSLSTREIDYLETH